VTEEQRQYLLESYVGQPVYEIECPRCIRRSDLVDDCACCGGRWMIPLAKIKHEWLDQEFGAAVHGDRPEWMHHGLYHIVDQCSGEIDRWLVSHYGVWYVTREEYFAAWEGRKTRREHTAFVKFAKKIWGEQL
jgi:hypothetical protein